MINNSIQNTQPVCIGDNKNYDNNSKIGNNDKHIGQVGSLVSAALFIPMTFASAPIFAAVGALSVAATPLLIAGGAGYGASNMIKNKFKDMRGQKYSLEVTPVEKYVINNNPELKQELCDKLKIELNINLLLFII